MAAEVTKTIKVVMVGNMAVGKSALMKAYIEGAPGREVLEAESKSTMGVDFKDKVVHRDGRRIKVQIWDTAGQERYRTITRAYYRGATVIMMVYDVSSRKTFDDLREWRREIVKHSKCRTMFLIGNKDDLDHRAVPTEIAAEFAEKHGMEFFETSAATGHNVDEAFEAICDSVQADEANQDGTEGGPIALGLQDQDTAGARRGGCAC